MQGLFADVQNRIRNRESNVKVKKQETSKATGYMMIKTKCHVNSFVIRACFMSTLQDEWDVYRTTRREFIE